MDKKIGIFIPKTNNTQEQLYLSYPVTFWYIPFHFTNSDHSYLSELKSKNWYRFINSCILYRDFILRSSDPWPQTRMLNVLCMSKDDNMYVSAQKLRIKTYFLGQVACRVVIWIILNCAHFLYNATWVNMHSKECLKRTRKMYNIEWLGVYCNVFHCSSSRHNIK